MGAIGPAFSTSMIAWYSEHSNYSTPYWIMAIIALVSTGIAQWLPEGREDT